VRDAPGVPATRRPLHGVFLGSHAVAEGLVTARQLKSGLYRRLLQNVYADPALTPDHRLYVRGAMLTIPDHAVIAGRSAAAWYDAEFAGATEPVLVVVPPGSSWRGPRGLRVHRSALGGHEIRTIDDVEGIVRLTTPLRTAWDLATLETTATAVGYLDAMVRAGHLEEVTLRRMGRPGSWRNTRIAKVMPLVDGRSQSPPESWVRVACARAGLPMPVPQFVVTAAGRWLGQVDLAWPEHRVIVEYEGPHHFDELQIRKDDRRYARFVAAGWRVIRLSAIDLRDMDAVIARIAAALGQPIAAS
jgi:Protein of unknown function (DUF559)